ncbi:hypothetical protein F5Y09DRAFT_271871 [Xylaria sp. FL1042]|nr:hypothetical protein F5Y09DRAFT_271871 [Xylaria sp. FL1042]
MSSSRDVVLQTAELVQEILLQLDMRTLLTAAQRVNRQWRELITSSPALKQALYFEPIAQSSGPATQNPLLVEAFPLWFSQKTKEEQLKVSMPFEMPCRDDFYGLPMAQESRRHAFMHPDATWRHMLVRQPPVPSLCGWSMAHGMMGDSHDFCLHEFPDGLRMGYFYDTVQEWVSQQVSYFNVFWDSGTAIAVGKSRCSDRMDQGDQDKLKSFASQQAITLLFYMVQQCCWEPPDVSFEEAFTFASPKAPEV